MKKLNVNAEKLIVSFLDTIRREKVWLRPHTHGRHWVGKAHQRKRVKNCAEWAAQNYDGDFVEIGAMDGRTTLVLAKLARKYNRKVIVIDPWSSAKEDFDGDLKYLNGGEYEIFCENTKDYSDVIEINRISSHDISLPEMLKQRDICFAWVDGSHTGVALKSDLNLVKHCQGVIGVDDISYTMTCNVCCTKRGYDLFEHFNEFCFQNSFQKIKFDWNAEGYIFCGYKEPLLAPDFLGRHATNLIKAIEAFSSIAVATYAFVGKLGADGLVIGANAHERIIVWIDPEQDFQSAVSGLKKSIATEGQPAAETSSAPVSSEFLARSGPPPSECFEWQED